MYWLSRRDEPNAFLSLDYENCDDDNDDGDDDHDDENIGMIRKILILDGYVRCCNTLCKPQSPRYA